MLKELIAERLICSDGPTFHLRAVQVVSGWTTPYSVTDDELPSVQPGTRQKSFEYCPCRGVLIKWLTITYLLFSRRFSDQCDAIRTIAIGRDEASEAVELWDR